MVAEAACITLFKIPIENTFVHAVKKFNDLEQQYQNLKLFSDSF